MRIVIYRYYHFSFVFFLLLSYLGFKINYLNLSDKSLFGKKLNLEKLSIKLKKYKICPLEIEDLKEIKSIQIVIHDLKNESFNLNKNSIKDLFLDKSVKFFGESNNLKTWDHILDHPILAKRDLQYNIFKRFINRQVKNFKRKKRKLLGIK